MTAPKLLDLFAGQGGAAKGYKDAGWHVTGVDITDHSRRYAGDEFVQDDALAHLARHGHEYDAIHASPPCQGYSIATAGNLEARAKYPRMIAATRELLNLTGRPWVIENVAQARRQMNDPTVLCGTMFGLRATDEDGTPLEMWRHRLFESNVPLVAPGKCRHGWHSPQVAGSYGGARRDKHEARYVRHGGYVPAKHVQEQLLGIDWMTQKGLFESIPPVYSEHIGHQLIEILETT